LNPLWLIAGLLGMTAGTLTWTIGFRLATVSYAGSFPTTTLALLMGIGGFLMTDRRRQRWSWILVAVSLVLGPFLRGAEVYFLEGPMEVGLLCLICAGIAAFTTRRKKPEKDTGTDGDAPD
jgi:hypothetical protein